MVNLVEFAHVVEILDGYSSRLFVDKALQMAGLDRTMLKGSRGFIPYAAEAIVIEAVARKTGERHLGAKLGRDFDYMTYGAYSVYVLSAPDLATALDRGRRAMLFIHPGSEIVLRQTETHLVVGRDSAGLSVVGHHHLDEGTPFVISQVAHHFLGIDWRPDWVELPNVRKKDLEALAELTGTEVRTGHDIPSVAIRLSDLSAPNPEPSQSEKTLSLTELQALMGVAPAQTTEEAVKQMLGISFKSGLPDEASISRLLAISSRTLQRALKAEGTSFRNVRSGFVAQRAETLLSQTEMSVDEIAKELGYSQSRAFRRAFKASTGLSPGAFRKTGRQS